MTRTNILVLLLLLLAAPTVSLAQSVSGIVQDPINNPLAGVRVTLYNVDTSFFAEDRTTPLGAFNFNAVPAGSYTLNASRADLAYQRIAITTNGLEPLIQDLTVEVDTVMGRWDVLVNSPEPLGGTNLCTLLPDGRLFYCHNTTDPFIFNPATDQAVLIPGSGTVQGCLGLAMGTDSVVIFIGGADQEMYGPGTKFVKTWNSGTGSWSAMLPVLGDFRWYPTTTTLADGRVLVIGGGNENNPVRTPTTELLDPLTMTTTMVGDLAIGNEVSPIVRLYNGKVLMTHRPPQLFDPVTEQWSLTGDFVQNPRLPNGDHSDLELILLPEGEVVAIGYKSFTPGVYGNMVEVYDPATGSWSLGTHNLPVRSRTKSLFLPNKKILVLAGEKEDPSDTTSTNNWNYTRLAHYYDPYAAEWRRLDDMNYFREYHANAVLVPDGRVIVVGGEGQPGNEPPFSVIEGFTPPYLFKGIRPEIGPLASYDLLRGQDIAFTATRTNALSQVIMMSLAQVTHFMNCGNERYVDLPFSQSGTMVTATLPSAETAIPNGFYMLMGMVDDIPSVGRIVRVGGDFNTTVTEHTYGPARLILAPNPAQDHVNITYTATANASAMLVVADALGKVVLQRSVLLVAGANTIAVDVRDLAPGPYQFLLRSVNGTSIGRVVITAH